MNCIRKGVGFCILLPLFAAHIQVLAFQFSPVSSKIAVRLLHKSNTALNSKNVSAAENILLPVFPLRKTVRIPTEKLTLNLYEERYLAMSESIIAQTAENRTFGALYSSDKPQIVKSGLGPIVPLVESGDIGTIFRVQHWEEGYISTFGGSRRRRIRLIATGVGRFQIKTVIDDGSGTSRNPTKNSLPFILVEAESIGDTTIDEQELKSYKELLARLQLRGLPDLFANDLEVHSSSHVDIGIGTMHSSELRSFQLTSNVVAEEDRKTRKDALKALSSSSRIEILLSALGNSIRL